MKISLSRLKVLTERKGVYLLGALGSKELGLSGFAGEFDQWVAEGFHGGLRYLERSGSDRLNPGFILPDWKSIVFFGFPFSLPDSAQIEPGYGRIGAYACGSEYQSVVKAELEKSIEFLSSELPEPDLLKSRVLCDTTSLSEKGLAIAAGCGSIGCNSLIVNNRLGSAFFLGEIIWNLEVDKVGSLEIERVEEGGSFCENCSGIYPQKCPGKALLPNRKLNCNKCISYLNIEKRGILNRSEGKMLGDWIFGCDVCQKGCPVKKDDDIECLEDFDGGRVNRGMLALEDVLSLRTRAEFEFLFGGTSLMRCRRAGLLRNAALVAMNQRVTSLFPILRDAALNDSSPVVRATCLRAGLELAEGGSSAELKLLIDCCRADLAEEVQRELSFIAGM